MEKPNITKETTETLLETKFLKVFDLQYAPGKHYFDATRRSKENLVALQSEELCKTMLVQQYKSVKALGTNGSRLRQMR